MTHSLTMTWYHVTLQWMGAPEMSYQKKSFSCVDLMSFNSIIVETIRFTPQGICSLFSSRNESITIVCASPSCCADYVITSQTSEYNWYIYESVFTRVWFITLETPLAMWLYQSFNWSQITPITLLVVFGRSNGFSF